MLLYSLKTIKYRGNLKTFSQKRSDWKLCIGEVRVDLEHLCSCSWKQCRIFHEVSHKNNYPLVKFHCIIKIMCQDLPLGCLHCLLVCAVQNRNFGCSAQFYIFYWNVKWFWNFLHCLSIIFFYFPNCFRIFGVLKYG